MKYLLVGFDSAWTATNSGGLVAACWDDGTARDHGLNRELNPPGPRIVDFPEAKRLILQWQEELKPAATIVLLDQPTVVENEGGQRDVDNIVSSLVSRRRGGMQPANTSKVDMFGPVAPVRGFLKQFGGAADPLTQVAGTLVLETYPVVVMMALGWELEDWDSRPKGRLPKYNPNRRKTFTLLDWQHVCNRSSQEFRQYGLTAIARWIDDAKDKQPRKRDQDGLDACLCLLVALYLAERKDCLMVGEHRSGYMVVPYRQELQDELGVRCDETKRERSAWVQRFRLSAGEK